MTNTSKQTHAAPEEKPTVELLRNRFKMMDEYVESIRKDNVNAGLENKYNDNFIQWRQSDSTERKIVENFIAKTTDKKRPGYFWQISDLKNRGLIPEEEESEYENTTYPYRKLHALFKVKTTDGRLMLMRHEVWSGLDAQGQEVHRSINNLDYIAKPRIEYDRIPKDPHDPQGTTVRVKIIRNPDNHENNLIREYITPYSKEKVDEFLKYAAGPIGQQGGTGLALKKEGVTNEVGATYEQFTSDEDFDATFERIRTPSPQFPDFYKEYQKKVKQAAEAEADQYQ